MTVIREIVQNTHLWTCMKNMAIAENLIVKRSERDDALVFKARVNKIHRKYNSRIYYNPVVVKNGFVRSWIIFDTSEDELAFILRWS